MGPDGRSVQEGQEADHIGQDIKKLACGIETPKGRVSRMNWT